MAKENGLQNVTVKKTELLKALLQNQVAHGKDYEEAVVDYRKAVQVLLEKALADSQSDPGFTLLVHLPRPEDHRDDYRRAVRMLEMSVDDTLTLTVQEFNQYVLDEWRWKEQFSTSMAVYKAQAVRGH